MPAKLIMKSIEPQFVTIHYDIKDSGVRDQFRLKLIGLGFIMETESVYYGLYTQLAHHAVEHLIKNEEDVKIYILTPMYPAEQAEFLRTQYEERFMEQFEDQEQKLQDTRDMLVDKLLKKDKDTGEEKPYTGNQILARVRSLQYFQNVLEQALIKRHERDGAKFQKAFERIELRMQAMDALIQKLEKSAKDRKRREEAQGKANGNKTFKEGGEGSTTTS